MGYQIRITYPDGSVHQREKVYKTKEGANKKAGWLAKHFKPTVRVVRSRS